MPLRGLAGNIARRGMEGSEFTEEEWKLVREGPALAGLIVLSADKGGTFRESLALARAYADARKRHAESALVDELASKGPPHTRRFGSPQELRDEGIETLKEASKLVDRTRPREEAQSYRAFVMTVAERVARAHHEGGEEISPSEREALEAVAESLGLGSRA
jgi:hypothetical protein